MIGISSVFNQNLVDRIESIIDNQDSLLRITNDTYLNIVNYLESVERQKSLAQIVTGGWIESIYVVTNLLENYNENPKIISLLASQKNVVENLELYLKKIENDKSIESTINDLDPLIKFYKSLELKETGKLSDNQEQKPTNKIIVGGNSEPVMTAEQFEVLKKEITKLRNKITNK